MPLLSVHTSSPSVHTSSAHTSSVHTSSVHTSLDGQAVGRAPFAVAIAPSALHPPACDVVGQLHHAVAGVAAELIVTARDRYGNRLRVGGSSLSLTILSMDHHQVPSPKLP